MGARRTSTVHDDGTTHERGPARRDRRHPLHDRARRPEGEDLLVVAGDNLFDFSLVDYVAFWRGKGDGSAIALYGARTASWSSSTPSSSSTTTTGCVSFVEKPPNPTTDLVAIADYLYHRDHVALIDTYLAEGNSPDQPGNLVAWLYRARAGLRLPLQRRVARHRRPRASSLEADNLLRARAGLEPRAEYAL